MSVRSAALKDKGGCSWFIISLQLPPVLSRLSQHEMGMTTAFFNNLIYSAEQYVVLLVQAL